MAADARLLWAPWAWVGGHWRERVVLTVGADGRWAAVTPGQPAPEAAERLSAPVLPGLVDAHSHAFQRAFVGLAERRGGGNGAAGHDDFWSWRDQMYRVALGIGPDELRAVATRLYRELLAGGYTQVCEFHYLQHAPDGRPYDDPLALAWALADAAEATGIGLTLLPVVYERAGFAQPALRDDQRRFRLGADEVWARAQALAAARRPQVTAGLAVHSLRAARPESLHRLRELAQGFDGPIHIHAAEQTGEVDDCLAATGQRPIQWLAAQGLLDARWQLVHATHAEPAEIKAVAASGAGIVVCPGTEANLGDGIPDLPRWLGAGVPLSVGSDSQVTRDWPGELRWLEYAQRWVRRQRNVCAAPGQPSPAERLFERALAGGAAAAGFRSWGLHAGARADLLVLDTEGESVLNGVAAERLLDTVVFGAPARPFARVMVAGRWTGA
jgi:formimidoylglutamate deiminase